jgi:lysozyme
VNYCTIGYGHLIALRRCQDTNLGAFGNKLSEADGSKLLEEDTRAARAAVQTLVSVAFSDDQFGALVSFVFNVGAQNFSKSQLRQLTNSGEFDLAARQFARWVSAGNMVLPGLVVRRSCEEALFRSKLRTDSSGHFSRESCAYPPLGATPNVQSYIDVETGQPVPN